MTTTAITIADPEVAALAFVNDCRAELGLPALDRLPCGIRNSAGDCPIAHGLAVGDDRRFWPVRAVIVSNTHAVACSKDTHRWSLPPAVQRFVCAFDNGRYPHLLEFPAMTTTTERPPIEAVYLQLVEDAKRLREAEQYCATAGDRKMARAYDAAAIVVEESHRQIRAILGSLLASYR